jgi:tRNA A-37 threonylcarbamoyl transferase component Bud32
MTDPVKLGKYDVQGVLGKGAMGVVYKATDPHIERTVAIKTVRKDLMDSDIAEQFLARFRNEARAAGRLHHPNIIGIYEYGEDDKVAYIAMEYVDGTGLREYLTRRAQFDVAQLVAIMTQLLSALDYAHSRGVVHRDIKPANLILTNDGVLKVADFGIARIDTSSLTMTGLVMGTPSYMSPEQCQGRPSDHRSDLFSAGVVFYELLTGRKPFAGAVETIAYQICHQEATPPSQVSLLPLSSAVDAVVSAALAKDPDQRFQNARAFSVALRLAAGEAAPPSTSGETTVVNLGDVTLHPEPLVWDDTVLTTVERQLAHFVGPMAKLMVRQAAPQAHDVHQLYAMLAQHIQDPERRQRFIEQPAVGEASGPHTAPSMRSGTAAARTGTRAGDARHATGSRGIAVPQPLEPAFVDQTTARLAVYLGPIARVLARKAAQQAHSADEFVALVAEHVGTQDRRAFLREIGYGEP